MGSGQAELWAGWGLLLRSPWAPFAVLGHITCCDADADPPPAPAPNSDPTRPRPHPLPPTLPLPQPEGPSFQVDGNMVTWEGWNFHVGFSWREGLILNNVQFNDAGTMRPVLYRAALAEVIVPYGEPRGAHGLAWEVPGGRWQSGQNVSPSSPPAAFRPAMPLPHLILHTLRCPPLTTATAVPPPYRRRALPEQVRLRHGRLRTRLLRQLAGAGLRLPGAHQVSAAGSTALWHPAAAALSVCPLVAAAISARGISLHAPGPAPSGASLAPAAPCSSPCTALLLPLHRPHPLPHPLPHCTAAPHRYFDAIMNDSRGGVTTIKKAVCMHEEDAGMGYKHYEYRNGHVEVRRNRRLVVSFISTIANYEYGER